MDMLMEEAKLPHYGVGGRTGVAAEVISRAGPLADQFANRIQDAVRKYMKMTGKAPSAEEVKQLEDHLSTLSKPTGNPVQTQARLMADTPAANQLVDKGGRPYKTMPDPKTGVPTTPERAQGFEMRDQFGSSPANQSARRSVMDPYAQNVFPEDEFMSMANTGRTSNRTWNKSTTPSTEDLAARQYVDEASQMADDTGRGVQDMGSYTMEQGPRSASAPFAEASSALESGPLSQIRGDLSTTLYPGAQAPKGPMAKTVEQIVADFRARGIEPDKEDIVNAMNAQVNPLRHNYTGENPIGQRPSGRAGIEDWRDQMRMSGQPESVITKHPSDWKPSNKAEYLTDTTPETRGNFATDWNMEDQVDRRRVQRKAEGGMFDASPRDMRAEMMVRGYSGGGDIKSWEPSPRQRISSLGQEMLEKAGIRRQIARRAADTFIGGPSSALPGGFGVADAATIMSPAAAVGMAPLYAAETGHSLQQGNYGEAALNSLGMLPAVGPIRRAFKGFNQ
jgi:hypothetical protein